MQSGLYVVGTPIGNLSDMTPRAVDVLQNVDLIAAEDTRVFGKLASRFDIKTKRVSCHEHNERDVIDGLIEKIQAGQSVAVVSDAGMPGSAILDFVLYGRLVQRGWMFLWSQVQRRRSVRWCCLDFQQIDLRSVVFLMKRNCVTTIK